MTSTGLFGMCLRSMALVLTIVSCSQIRMSSGAAVPTMRKVVEDNQETDGMKPAADLPSIEVAVRNAESDVIVAKASPRAKRDSNNGCGGCGNGNGSDERRRRRRRRQRRRRLYRVVRSAEYDPGDYANDLVPNSTSSFQPVLQDPNTVAPFVYITNSTVVLGSGEEMLNAEAISIAVDSGGNDDKAAAPKVSDDEPTNNLIMPYVGTYGSKKAPPGATCNRDADCVVGAVCKHVSDSGHCVCEPPLVNLGNACVPMSGGAPA